jgi:LPXTG-motif cell wall-anchored protein
VSDTESQVLSIHLVPRIYSFVETQAPTGYILNTSQVDFTISGKEEGQPHVVIASDNFINYQGSAKLIKVDENGKTLSGAIFNVVNSDTHEVAIEGIKSDANGVIKADNLKPGKYSFVETKAPTGYQLSQETKTFEITAKAENQPQVVNSGKFINKKLPLNPKKSELPKTGEQQNTLISLFGLIMMISALLVLFKRQKA